LLRAKLGEICPRQLATIIGARRLDSPRRRRTMKEQYHASHCVQVHQILALGAHLLGAHGIGATRSQRPTTTRDVEPIVTRDFELAGEERVRGFLQPPIRAGDYESVRPRWRPHN
jgi:hypothetical protein